MAKSLLEKLSKQELLEIAELLLPKCKGRYKSRTVSVSYKGIRYGWNDTHVALLSISMAFYKLNKGRKRGLKPLRNATGTSSRPEVIATAVEFLIIRGEKPNEAKHFVAKLTKRSYRTLDRYYREHRAIAQNAAGIISKAPRGLEISDDNEIAVKRILTATLEFSGTSVTIPG